MIIGVILMTVNIIFGDLSAKEVLDKVKKSYDSISDASGDFDQVVEYKIAKLNQQYNGKLSFKKKDKLKIETDEQTLVTDGETSWTYSVLNEKVIIDNYDPENSELSPSRFFIEFPKDFYIEVIGSDKLNNKKVYVLKLTPKNTDNYIQGMKLWVDDELWFVRQIQVGDINGSTTIYKLKNLEINKGLPDSHFKFIPNKNVEIIDLR